jgi:hypothetical protein
MVKVARGHGRVEVEWFDATARIRENWQASAWRNAIGSRVSTEVIVKASVLLNDPNNVIDFAKPGRPGRAYARLRNERPRIQDANDEHTKKGHSQ